GILATAVIVAFTASLLSSSSFSVPSTFTKERPPCTTHSKSAPFTAFAAAVLSAGSIWRFRTTHVAARYMSPVLTYIKFNREATSRATVLFPDAAGPSIATTTWLMLLFVPFGMEIVDNRCGIAFLRIHDCL